MRQLARFLAIGLVNTAFGYGLFFAALAAGVHSTLALAISTALSVLFNFATTGRLVFDNRDGARLWRFLAVYALVFMCNVALLAGLEHAGVTPALGQALLLTPLVVLTYLLNRTFVFGAQP